MFVFKNEPGIIVMLVEKDGYKNPSEREFLESATYTICPLLTFCVFFLFLSCLVLSCLVLSCLVLSCFVLSCLALSFRRSKGKGMMDLGATAKGQEPPAYGSAYGLLAEVATTLCPVDILSLVRGAGSFQGLQKYRSSAVLAANTRWSVVTH